MNYETMDWKAEAKRLAKAFAIKSNCYFTPDEDEHVLRHDETGWLPGRDEVWVSVRYKVSHRDLMVIKERRAVGIEVVYETHQTGTKTYCGMGKTENLELQIYLARALFCLDLLTPEVESALQVSVSHHQKLEWMVEFEK